MNSTPEKAFVDKLIDGAIAGIKATPGVAACIAKNTAAGTYADFYEFFTSKTFALVNLTRKLIVLSLVPVSQPLQGQLSLRHP
ncbi:MAG: hypothetical protein EOP04_01380 [Proteobacteria bacterium]|nr:MAG: hypothetical protein EOP04_01380 [Pseudomonadota bacterium]